MYKLWVDIDDTVPPPEAARAVAQHIQRGAGTAFSRCSVGSGKRENAEVTVFSGVDVRTRHIHMTVRDDT